MTQGHRVAAYVASHQPNNPVNSVFGAWMLRSAPKCAGALQLDGVLRRDRQPMLLSERQGSMIRLRIA